MKRHRRLLFAVCLAVMLAVSFSPALGWNPPGPPPPHGTRGTMHMR